MIAISRMMLLFAIILAFRPIHSEGSSRDSTSMEEQIQNLEQKKSDLLAQLDDIEKNLTSLKADLVAYMKQKESALPSLPPLEFNTITRSGEIENYAPVMSFLLEKHAGKYDDTVKAYYGEELPKLTVEDFFSAMKGDALAYFTEAQQNYSSALKGRGQAYEAIFPIEHDGKKYLVKCDFSRTNLGGSANRLNNGDFKDNKRIAAKTIQEVLQGLRSDHGKDAFETFSGGRFKTFGSTGEYRFGNITESKNNDKLFISLSLVLPKNLLPSN